MMEDKDSAFVQLLHQNNALPISCQIKNLEGSSTIFVSKQIQYTNNLIKEPCNSANIDSVPITKDYYFSAQWQEMLSYNNVIFKTKNRGKEIFSANKDSIKQTNANIQEIPVFKIHQTSTTNLLIISLLVIYALFAWLKISYPKYFNQFIRSLFTYSEANKLFFDQNALVDRAYLILNMLFIFSGGIFLLLLGNTANIQMPYQSIFSNLFVGLLIVLSIYIFRFITTKISGWLLNQYSAFNEYLHSSFLYYKATGLFILPIITIAGFVKNDVSLVILIIGGSFFLLTYFASIYRGTKIMLKKGVLLFYWILYLCTVEFFPLVLLYKYLSLRT
jgi:hypothetical protein